MLGNIKGMQPKLGMQVNLENSKYYGINSAFLLIKLKDKFKILISQRIQEAHKLYIQLTMQKLSLNIQN